MLTYLYGPETLTVVIELFGAQSPLSWKTIPLSGAWVEDVRYPLVKAGRLRCGRVASHGDPRPGRTMDFTIGIGFLDDLDRVICILPRRFGGGHQQENPMVSMFQLASLPSAAVSGQHWS
jgi:hypothetical protein